MESIHAYDGMMSLSQIDQLFFSGNGRTQPRHRMRCLYNHGYVNMPSAKTIHQIPYGVTLYWLNTKGAAVVAALQGKSLKGFRWRKIPRYSQVTHDLAVNDFRIQVGNASQRQQDMTLLDWQPEGEFLSYPDMVQYQLPNGSHKRRQIRPDGFFTLEHRQHHSPFAFLLEIDMSTEHNPRFGREKVIPGVAYLKSEAFHQRFGLRYGRFLVVTTGERRMHNLKAQTERVGGQGLFYFTTFDQVTNNTVLNSPIWYLAGEEQPRSIMPTSS